MITSSLLFNCFITYTEENGNRQEFPLEDFLAGGHKWMDYTFKMYVGQGSFWRIEKNGETIFQTT